MNPLMMAGVGAGMSVLGSLFGGRSAKKAAARAHEQAMQRQAQIQQYGNQAASRLDGQQAMLSDVAFKPWNITSGNGTNRINPLTGEITQELSQPLQQQQDWSYQQAQNIQGQLGNFDRDQFAQQEYQRHLALLQPSRNDQMAGMMNMARRKGVGGLSVSSLGSAPGQGVAVNPLAAGLGQQWGQQDQALAARSYGMADNEMARLYGLQSGLFGQGLKLNDAVDDQMEQAMRFGQQDFNNQRTQFQDQYGLFRDQEQYRKMAALGGMEGIQEAQNMGIQARLGRDQGIASSMTKLGGQMIGAGMFGSGGVMPQVPAVGNYERPDYGMTGMGGLGRGGRYGVGFRR